MINPYGIDWFIVRSKDAYMKYQMNTNMQKNYINLSSVHYRFATDLQSSNH